MPAKARKSYDLGAKELLIDLEVPSGALCQVRRPGPMGLIRAGVFDKMDLLGSIVQSDHIDRVAGVKPVPQSEEERVAKQQAQIKEVLSNPAMLRQAEALYDRVMCYVVVQPAIEMAWRESGKDLELIPPEERDPDKVYSDRIDFEDKMFIFHYVLGGTSDLESFRKEFQETLGRLEVVPGLSSAPQ